jgi:RimJ/RimL family protein N-acetyltransferase
MEKILTKNLILREFNISDLKLFYKISQDDKIKKYAPSMFYADESKAREELDRIISCYPNMELAYYLAIVKKDTNILIGHIGISESDLLVKYGSESDINEYNKRGGGHEIEYAICKDYRGFGYASEALKAFAPWCKNKFNTGKICASTLRQNIASCKTLSNAGFTILDEQLSCKIYFNNRG